MAIPNADKDEMIAADVKLRSTLHFNADPAFVKSLYSHNTKQLHRSAALFTDSEWKEFELRQAALPRDDRAIRQGIAAAAYGGAYIDHASGGTLVVGFAGELDRYHAEALKLVQNPDRLVVREVTHSEASLDEAILPDRLLPIVEAHGAKLAVAETDIPRNLVRVSVAFPNDVPEDGRALALDAMAAAMPVTALVEEGEFPVLVTKWNDPMPPIVGGHYLAVVRQDGKVEACTAGLAARRGGHAGFLIAGHCAYADGDLVRHGGKFGPLVGVVNGRQYSGSADYAFVDQYAVSGAYSQPRVFGYWPTSFGIEGADFEHHSVGTTRCTSGTHTSPYYHCGALLSTNVSACSADPPYVCLSNMRKVDGQVSGGDSGSPVWDPVGMLGSGAVQSSYAGDYLYTYWGYMPGVGLRIQGDAAAPSVGNPSWYESDRTAGASHPTVAVFQYGFAGAQPMMCDWDGDGRDTPGVFSNGVWHVRNSSTTGAANWTWAFGAAGDQAFCGDWNNDGIDTTAVRRGITLYYRNWNWNGPVDLACNWGNPGDVAFAGNWDGAAWDSVALKRNAQYFMTDYHCGEYSWSFSYSTGSHKVVAGDWDWDGDDSVGTFGGGYFYLKDTNTCCYADYTFPFGIHSDKPMAGNYFDFGPSTVSVARGI